MGTTSQPTIRFRTSVFARRLGAILAATATVSLILVAPAQAQDATECAGMAATITGTEGDDLSLIHI